MPEIKLKKIENYKALDYSVKVAKDVLDERLENLSKEYKTFEDKKIDTKSELGDQVILQHLLSSRPKILYYLQWPDN